MFYLGYVECDENDCNGRVYLLECRISVQTTPMMLRMTTYYGGNQGTINNNIENFPETACPGGDFYSLLVVANLPRYNNGLELPSAAIGQIAKPAYVVPLAQSAQYNAPDSTRSARTRSVWRPRDPAITCFLTNLLETLGVGLTSQGACSAWKNCDTCVITYHALYPTSRVATKLVPKGRTKAVIP